MGMSCALSALSKMFGHECERSDMDSVHRDIQA